MSIICRYVEISRANSHFPSDFVIKFVVLQRAERANNSFL